MADRGTKNGGFAAPKSAGGLASDSDSASVDTLLEGVLGGDVQSAKARIPRRARQETAPGLSVILDEEPPMGGRRKAFLPEEEQVARMAPTIPSSLRADAAPHDTVVADGPPGAPARGPSALLVGFIVLAVALVLVGAGGLYWGIMTARRAEQAAELAASAAAKALTQPSASTPSREIPSAAPRATASSVPSVASLPASSGATLVPSASPPPASTYGHLVPGGRH